MIYTNRQQLHAITCCIFRLACTWNGNCSRTPGMPGHHHSVQIQMGSSLSLGESECDSATPLLYATIPTS